MIVPDAVVAQVWRSGTGRQARVSALLGLGPQRCVNVPLDTPAAKRTGMAAGVSGHTDIVDIHVALIASDAGAAVITSDREGIVAIDAGLRGSVVDI